jgi:hypothetical protein
MTTLEEAGASVALTPRSDTEDARQVSVA